MGLHFPAPRPTLLLLLMLWASPGLPAQATEATSTLEAVRAERQRLEAQLPAFVESLALPGKPFGRFKFHQAQQQPWLLYASQQMLSLAVLHGYWDQLDETRKAEWLELLLASQDPQTGLFRCPVVTDEPVAYYRAITLKMVNRFDSIGVQPRYPLPKAEAVCPGLAELPEKLAALPWNGSSYAAGSDAGHWAVTRLNELKQQGTAAADDPYVRTIVEFLEAAQDPATGFWGHSGNRTDGMNGVLKTLGIYQRLDRPLPHAERILDGLLSVQAADGSFGDDCSPWNALELLTFLSKQTDYRRADIQRAVLRLPPTLERRRQPDGFYSANADGCLVGHAGVRLCAGPQPIGDLTGTSQTLSILKMIEALSALPPTNAAAP